MALGFNRTFKLDLSILSTALQAYEAKPGLSDLSLAKAMGVGGEKGTGYSRWLLACGLRGSKPRKLTDLGALLMSEDQHLRDPGTKVVLHYQLASNQYSEVWWSLIDYIAQHREIEARQAVDQLLRAGIGTNNRKHLLTDVRLFFDAYLNSDCFGSLQAIVEVDAGRFIARSPSYLPSLILGYALYSRWEASLQTSTIPINNVLTESGQAGKVFFLDGPQLLEKLRELEFQGIVKVSRIADLDNVAYTFDGTALDILKMYYQGRG